MDNCFLVTEHIRRKLTETGENPDRARNQFKLVKDMLSKKDEAEAIVEKYL